MKGSATGAHVAPAVAPDVATSPTDLGLFSDDERDAIRPPKDLLPSQWAEKYRELKRGSSRLGPWRNSNQPTLVGIMDLCVRRTIREIWIKKSGQIGVSEALRCAIGRDAHLAPAPILYVLPNEKKGKKDVRTKLIPLFEDTRVLAALSTGRLRDKKLESITLRNSFELALGYAGSATAMSGDPFSKVFLDEVDKFARQVTGQADPVGEARTRILSYKNQGGKVIGNSTPSTAEGRIAKEYEACPIKLFYYAPCPHCGRCQQFIWDRLGFEHFDLPSAQDRAARVRKNAAAWLECENDACTSPDRRRRSKDHPERPVILEKYKRRILLAGYWGTESGSWKIFFDGHEEGEQPDGDKVGIYIWRAYDLVEFWHNIAAEFIECDGDVARLQDFYKLVLGQEWTTNVEVVRPDVITRKCLPDPETDFEPPPSRIIPPWVSRLLMLVDTQADKFYWLIRGYGQQFRSQRIDHGEVPDFATLEEILERAYYPYEGNILPPRRAWLCAIDTGGGIDREGEDATRTDQVYQWCNRDPRRRLPIKGSSRPIDPPIRWRRVTYQDPHQRRDPYEVVLHLVDPLYWRDLLASQMTATRPVVDEKTGELTDKTVDQWMLNDRNDPIYNQHLTNVKRIRTKNGDRWVPKTQGARHDHHDLETYALAIANGPGQCHALPTPEMMAREISASQAALKNTASLGVTAPDGRPFLATRRNP